MDILPQSAVSVDDDWRRWIAENLVLGGDPQDLFGILVARGIDADQARMELQLAADSPYVGGAHQAAQRLASRIKKRDWVLGIQQTLNQQDPGGAQIVRRHQLTRDTFYSDFYLRNRPVIITGMLQDWPALQRWSLPDLRARLGHRVVEVQSGRERDAGYEIKSDEFRSNMLLRDFIDTIEQAGETNDCYMTANNSSKNRVALAELWQDIGRLPQYLNADSPDDGFLWFGPAGTRTPFHHDLTNNFMAQVLGRKRIKMIPAFALPHVYNHRHCFSQLDGLHIDYVKFPQMQGVPVLECELAPGEILFLPVGSWHFVQALDVSMTVSFINFQLPNDYSTAYTTYGDL